MTEQERVEIERRDETEYLATLSNVQWFIYPFFKTFEVIGERFCGCKSRARRENERRWAEREKLARERTEGKKDQ